MGNIVMEQKPKTHQSSSESTWMDLDLSLDRATRGRWGGDGTLPTAFGHSLQGDLSRGGSVVYDCSNYNL